MSTAAQLSDTDEAMMEARVPEARELIASMLRDAAANGVPAESMTAALLAEALQRLHRQHGPLAMASVLGNIAGAIAGAVTPPGEIN